MKNMRVLSFPNVLLVPDYLRRLTGQMEKGRTTYNQFWYHAFNNALIKLHQISIFNVFPTRIDF